MASIPTVRNLQSLIQTIGQSVKGQQAQLDQQIIANDKSGQAQVAGLDASKQQAFGQIEQAAQDKNMLFSGFTPDEQAKYTAATYLPALAKLQETIASTRAGLIGQKNQLNTDVFNKAFDTQQQDIAVLNDWKKMTAQQKFEASEAEKQRVFQAQQNQQDRAAAAANSARSNATPDTSAARSAALKVLTAKGAQGSDQKVSPATFQKALNAYVGAGGAPEDFRSLYSGYANLAWSPASYGYA